MQGLTSVELNNLFRMYVHVIHLVSLFFFVLLLSL